MTDQAPRKTCNVCYSEIDARARTCPHCGHPQTRLAGWLARHPSFPSALPVLFVVVVMLLFGFLVRRLFDHGADFRPHRDQIRVISSEVFFEQGDDGPIVYVVGKLKNEGDVPWGDFRLEVQFLDSSGKLFDIARDLADDAPVLPHDEMGSKMKARRDFPEDRYASHQVFVRFARDARRRW